VRQRMRAFDPDKYRRQFEDLREQLVRLYTHWTIFLCLYTSSSSQEVLHATAKVTFAAIFDSDTCV
jgi:hypothetical protein